MTFVWPQALLAAAAHPARACSPIAPSTAASGARSRRSVRSGAFGHRCARPAGRAPTAPAGAVVAPGRAGGAVRCRADRDGRRPRPAAGHGQRAAPGGHGHPRLRHLGQHGRHGPRADPDGGGQGGGHGVRRSASRPSVVIGVVAFSDSGISVQQPTNDQAAVLAAHRPAQAAARDVARPGHPTRRCTPSRWPPPVRTSTTTATARPSRPPAPTPVPAGHPRPGGHRAADRRREQRAARSAGRRPRPRPTGACASTPSGSAARAGATLDLDGFQVHTQLDEATLQQIADRPAAPTTARTMPTRSRRSTTTSTRRSSSGPRRSS